MNNDLSNVRVSYTGPIIIKFTSAVNMFYHSEVIKGTSPFKNNLVQIYFLSNCFYV